MIFISIIPEEAFKMTQQNSKAKIKILLVLVFLIALFFRFFKISSRPISLNWDEATFAYNAYSILKTGKDEYGTKLPLAFKSIGDYKCPLYVYLMVPVIKAIGLNELAVRFLPSFLGALTIPLFFLITLRLFGRIRLSLFASAVLSISPWHLQFTRAGADVAISTFFLTLGIWLFLEAIRSRRKYLILSLSLTSFVLTFYSYYGERLFTPLALLIWLVFYRREIIGSKIGFVKSLILPFLILLPLVGSLVSPGHRNKVLMTTIFGYRRPIAYLERLKKEDKNLFFFNIFHNAPVEYGLAIIDHYFNHFSPSFLFVKGPEDNRQRIEGMGMLYWSDLILLAFAWLALIKNFKKEKNLKLVLIWLLISPLPAAITRDVTHARRAFNMVYPLSIFMAYGLDYLLECLRLLKKKLLKSVFLAGFLVFFSWSFCLYFLSYYVFTPLLTYEGPGGWQFGYKELVNFVSPLKKKYQRVIIDTSYQGPYIYFLFYESYPPEKYQPQAVLVKKDEFSLGEGKGYDNYEFRDIYWPADRGRRQTLFAGPPERIPLKDIDPRQMKLLGTIKFPDGKTAFHIVEIF